MKNKRSIVIAIVAVFCCTCLLACFLLLSTQLNLNLILNPSNWSWWNQPQSSSLSVETQKLLNDFKDKNSYGLVVTSKEYTFFIKNKVINEGEIIFGVADTVNPQHKLHKRTSKGAEYFEGSSKANVPYATYSFDPFNSNCFAVYLNGEYLGEIPLIEEPDRLLPSPSDAWMCEGFDFENGLDYLVENSY